jgi:iron(III) transport system substrate-binding protein
MKRMVFGVALAVGAVVATPASAQLNVICSMQAEACLAVMNAFEKQTGIKVSLTYKSSGETFAQVNAEKENPKTDIWFTGTGDPHLQAADQDLTLPYKSPMLDQLHRWAQGQAKISATRRSATTPARWASATTPSDGEEEAASSRLLEGLAEARIQGRDPDRRTQHVGHGVHGAGDVRPDVGEDKAFDYLKKLHKNVNQYVRSGAAPIKAAARGETAIGSCSCTTWRRRSPAASTSPGVAVRGTGYEIGSMSIIKGARNLENAKKFYDWALTPDAQKLLAANKSFQLASNKATPQPPESPALQRHQADRLRPEEIRIGDRAQAPAGEVGQGSLRLPK